MDIEMDEDGSGTNRYEVNIEMDEDDRLLTKAEYELFCIQNGLENESANEMGDSPFVKISKFNEISNQTQPIHNETADFYNQIFDLLNSNEILSREKIEKYSKDLNCDKEKLLIIFEILKKDEIRREDFIKILSKF